MANTTKKVVTSEQDAFEIIETAIEDMETLRRAFDLISDVCKEFNAHQTQQELFIDHPKALLN